MPKAKLPEKAGESPNRGIKPSEPEKESEMEKKRAVIQLLSGLLPSRLPPVEASEYTELSANLIRQCQTIVEMTYATSETGILIHGYQLFRDDERLGAPAISKRFEKVNWKGKSTRSVSNLLNKIREELTQLHKYSKAGYDSPGTVDVIDDRFLESNEIKQIEEFLAGKTRACNIRAILKLCHNKRICSEDLWERVRPSEEILGYVSEHHNSPKSVHTLGRARSNLMFLRELIRDLLNCLEFELPKLEAAVSSENAPQERLGSLNVIREKIALTKQTVDRFDRNEDPAHKTFSDGSGKRDREHKPGTKTKSTPKPDAR